MRKPITPKRAKTGKFPNCPKCNGKLERTESDGLWCPNGCYENEHETWLALQRAKAPEIIAIDTAEKWDAEYLRALVERGSILHSRMSRKRREVKVEYQNGTIVYFHFVPSAHKAVMEN